MKSTERNLEKNEVEGTRCPNTYSLFQSFTSKYPLTPDPVPDASRRLMTITGRLHRFLVNTVDATEGMRERAESDKDIIITDYLKDRWDAPVLKGIKGIFCLIGRHDNHEATLHSREHACFCDKGMNASFNERTHQLIMGSLRKKTVLKLPLRRHQPRKFLL